MYDFVDEVVGPPPPPIHFFLPEYVYLGSRNNSIRVRICVHLCLYILGGMYTWMYVLGGGGGGGGNNSK